MIPKLKAKELVDKFRKYVDTDFAGDKGFEYSKEAETHHAKQCALIAVDELIKEQTMWQNGELNPILYWQEVKQEIELL